MSASVNDMADAAVAAIQAAWSPTAPDSVERDYLFRSDLDTMTGRQVRVYPLSYTDAPADRGSLDGGESVCEFGIGVTVAERYAGEEAKPPRSWIDDLVEFAEAKVYNVLSNRLPGVSGSVTLRADVSVYDVGILGQNQAFWSEFEFVFRVLM